MHLTAWRWVEGWAKTLPKGTNVIDIGSLKIGPDAKCPRELFDRYTGVDLRDGDNVDVVMAEPFKIPFPDNHFDALLCANTLEHCTNPFELIKEGARVIRPLGLAYAIAPTQWKYHPHPVDTFRFMPDGMRAIFDWAGLVCQDANVDGPDCWAYGYKPV